jgi:hypothetical protein
MATGKLGKHSQRNEVRRLATDSFLAGGREPPAAKRRLTGAYAPLIEKKKKKRKPTGGGWRRSQRTAEEQRAAERQSVQRKKHVTELIKKRNANYRHVDIYGRPAAQWASNRSAVVKPRGLNMSLAERQETARNTGELRGMNGKAYFPSEASFRGVIGFVEVDDTTCRLVDGCTLPALHPGMCAMPTEAFVSGCRSSRHCGAPASSSAVCDASSCSICFDQVGGGGGAEEGQDDNESPGGVTRCGHRFHTSCLQRWLRQQVSEKKDTCCAVCRTPLPASVRRMFTQRV